MEGFKIENLSFAYSDKSDNVLEEVSFSVNSGDFVLICGKSGCGKTTLLRLLKPAISPFGKVSGSILFGGKPLTSYTEREQASKIGFVMQNPDNQIVTDKVWHELAFGMESLGFSNSEIRRRVAETASFFGIQSWFFKNTCELSGGQKQLLTLASVMVMQPSVIILDEPTSSLDPISAQSFLKTLEKINRELGTTIIISEHRLEDVFPLASSVIVMDNGKITANDTPKKIGRILKSLRHEMYQALPAPVRVYEAIDDSSECPLTVCDGRLWLEEYAAGNTLMPELIPQDKPFDAPCENTIAAYDVWFRYSKELPDIIKGLSLEIKRGELYALVGGNGTGKTTALSVISGILTPYRGKIFINGIPVSKTLYNGILGFLPQNPQCMFTQRTVYLDLYEMLSTQKISAEEREKKLHEISALCHIEGLLDSHPYDLSGGEQQRAALAKLLLLNPQLLLLDEPTKGMDASFKDGFADIIKSLNKNGVTVLMVSHDIEFCAEYADRCAMLFDGSITACGKPREFFSGNSFYTTSANRMARSVLPNAVLADDIIYACGGTPQKYRLERPKLQSTEIRKAEEAKIKNADNKKSFSPLRLIFGGIFSVLFLLTLIPFLTDLKPSMISLEALQAISLFEAAATLFCFFPKFKKGTALPRSDFGNSLKRTVLSAIFLIPAVSFTIYAGIHFFADRKYYFISLMIILETALPFCLSFEAKRPQARELVLISVLSALTVSGRIAFFMLPQFKPSVALVIITGMCLGGEAGFLTGAVSGFVSNFFFGQGPWTPWQMFAPAIIGFIAGVLSNIGMLKKSKPALCVFGFISTLVIYGGILNTATVIMTSDKITLDLLKTAYAMGLPFDLIHAFSTVFFLWFISEPMLEKLERIKLKYGLYKK